MTDLGTRSRRRVELRAARYARALAVYQSTSCEAWQSVLPHLSAVDRAIMDCIAEYLYFDGQGMAQVGMGATCEEVEEVTGLKHQTAAAQIRHMTEAGLLRASTLRRPTKSGRTAIVWTLAPTRADAVSVEEERP